MLITIPVIKKAAKRLLRSLVLDEIEDRDSEMTLPRKYKGDVDKFVDFLMKKEIEGIMYFMGEYMGMIGAGWGNDAGLVFYHAGLLEDEDEAALVLYRVIMACWGHGIGIGDDHAEHFNKAKAILDKYAKEPMEETPGHFDNSEFHNAVVTQHLITK
jgi:hypothetical protein